jgi:hypothetical protein
MPELRFGNLFRGGEIQGPAAGALAKLIGRRASLGLVGGKVLREEARVLRRFRP